LVYGFNPGGYHQNFDFHLFHGQMVNPKKQLKCHICLKGMELPGNFLPAGLDFTC
jgi:hypothetical protein